MLIAKTGRHKKGGAIITTPPELSHQYCLILNKRISIPHMPLTRPYVLSVAGFDPSAGAGLLADTKTFEQCGVYGLGVVSALTYQNDIAFEGMDWVSLEKMMHQIVVLKKRFDIRYVKVGLIEDMKVLNELLRALHHILDEPVIVYDPILMASAGYGFYAPDGNLLSDILAQVYCITPNIPEAHSIFGTTDLAEKLLAVSHNTNVYLKGGHGDGELISDTLYTKGYFHTYINQKLPHGTKHGSGCVLSAALIAYLALGMDINNACEAANKYTYQFLSSNDTLLGYHNMTKG